MNIFGVGLPEIAVISALALVVFGPKRLPELGRSLGKTLKGLQTASNEFEKEIKKAMDENENENDNAGGDLLTSQGSKDKKAKDEEATSTF